MIAFRDAAAVAAGAAAGSLARYAIAVGAQDSGLASTWATITVNLVGCLAMGMLVSAVVADPGAHALWRPLLGVGLLGGFTTFSAFAGDAILLVDRGAWQMAAAYVIVSLAGSLLGLRGGLAIGDRWRDSRSAR